MSAHEIPEITGRPATPQDSLPPEVPDTRPRSLTFSSVSRDRRRIHLVDADGHEYTLEVDDALTGALAPRGASRMEKPMEASLRPRDIQARIRSGETPEDVAAAANTTVERIMPFAVPVMAERQHVAERAQKASVRRRAGESGVRTLGNAVAAHLGSLNLDPELVEWDAWRRTDGRWTLVGAYDTPTRSGTAELTYDAPGSFVVLDNDDARWLVGELVEEPEPAPAPADDLQRARRRRLSAVSPDDAQLPFESAETVPAPQPIEAYLDSPASDTVSPVDPEAETAEQPAVTDVPAEQTEPEPAAPAAEESEPEPEPAPRRKVRKSRGRASVPSWDEIMFGGGSSE